MESNSGIVPHVVKCSPPPPVKGAFSPQMKTVMAAIDRCVAAACQGKGEGQK
jgi:hypothetical protein